MSTSPASLAAESYTRLRARRGLAIYFAVLVPLTAVFEALMIAVGATMLNGGRYVTSSLGFAQTMLGVLY